MANTLKIKRGSNATTPQGQLAEPLFTTDTYDLYIGKGGALGNQRFQKYIASGTSSQFLKGDGTLDSTTYQPTSEKGQNNGYASLDAGGKIPAAQLPSSVIEYKGTWNANTNTPTLADGTGDTGDVYIVSVGGTQNLGSGAITFAAGDWVMYNGAIWQKSTGSNAVASVNGQTGVVTITFDQLSPMTTLGDIIYGGASGAGTRLAGNTLASKRFLTQTGDGTNSAAPSWGSIAAGDVPTLNQNTTGSAATLTTARTFTIGATGKTFDGSANVSWTAAEIGLTSYLPLTGGTLTGALTATAFIPSGSSVPTNGMYLPSANTLGLSANSTKVIEISDSGRVSIGATSPTTDALTVFGAITTTNGGAITAAGTISSGSTISSGLNITAVSTISGSALIPTGTTAPTVGMYLVSGTSTLNGVLGFSTNATKRLEINNSTGDATFTNNISAANLSGTNTGDQTLAGLGGVPTSRTITINGTSFDLSANRTYTVGTIGGSGSSGYVSKFSAPTTIGNSLIYDNGVRAISVGNSSTNSWASPFYVIEGGSYGGFLGFQTNAADVKFGVGAYWNGSNYVYTNTSIGFGLFNIGGDATNGYLDFYGAPASTAGLNATPTKKFGIDNSGNGHFVESIGVGFTSGAPNGRIDFRNPANAIIVGKNTIGGTNTYSSIRLTTANSGGVGDSIGEIRGLSTNVNNRDTALTFLTSEGSAGQTEKLRIAATGAATFSSSAAKVMEIQSSTATGGYVRYTYNGTTSIGYIGSSSQLSGLGAVSDLELRADNNLILTTTSGQLRITSGGNVGIGTTSPDVTGFGYTTLTIKGGTTAGYAGVLELQTTQTTTNGQNVGIIAFLDGTSRNAQIGVQRDTSTSTSNMMFYTNAGSGIVERMRITSDGYLRLVTKGIQFNNDTADANSLDDYEEGTWTPTIEGDGSNPTLTYSTQVGRYTKIGRVVTIHCALQPNSTSVAGTGILRFGGLPFTSANIPDVIGTGVANSNGNFNWGTGKTSLIFSVGVNTTKISVFAMQNGTVEAQIPVNNFNNSSQYLLFSITYITAS